VKRVYVYKCEDCDDTFDVLVEFEQRDEPQDCTICGKQDCERTWHGWTPNVSTTKLSQSIPDAVGKGRFDTLRRKQELRKEKAASRENRDRVTERKIDKEMKKL